MGGPRQGALIGGRYRLEQALRPVDMGRTLTDGGQLWRAEDVILSRPVAVRLLWDAPAPTRRAFLAAAAATGRSTTPLLAATYDAAEELFPTGRDETNGSRPGAARPLCYLVREWVEGTSLRDLLLDGPLQPEHATALLRDAAAALAHLHQHGHAHGRVHPGNLLIRDDAQVRLCDAGVALALSRPTDPDDGGGPAAADAELDDQFRQDALGLGRSLYAALTGRWPDEAWRGLPAAPRTGEAPTDTALAPRQVRAGVPKRVDAVVASVLGLDPLADTSPLRSAAQIAAALDVLPVLPAAEPAAPALTRPYHPWRRRSGFIGLGALLVILAVALGLSLGRDNGRATPVPVFTALPTPPGAPSVVTVPIVGVTSFDPPPGDGSEYPQDVGLAHDGKQSTAWPTQVYATRTFGQLKHGVGLVVDLGTVRKISEVDLTFPSAGTDVQLRAMAPTATAPGSKLEDFRLVAAQSNVGQAVALPSTVSARYWLIWLTGLPPNGNDGFKGGISEMAFRS